MWRFCGSIKLSKPVGAVAVARISAVGLAGPAEFPVTVFKKHFGDDLPALEAEFLRYMRAVN